MRSLSPWVFTTDACNLRCPYCFEEHKNNIMSEAIWSAISEHFIGLISEGVLDSTYFRLSGGEPFTCFDSWREFPVYLKKVLGCSFNAGVITNFTLLNDDILKYLIENNISCGVSLDGTRYSKVDINGNSTSKKVMENLDWYIGEGGKCNILSVFGKDNVGTGEILELAKFVAKYNLSWHTNSDIFVMQGNDSLDQMYYDLVEAIEYLDNYNDYDISKFSFQFLQPCTPYGTGCSAGVSLLSIGVNGDIYPCHTCSKEPIANIMTCDNIVKALDEQTIYPLGCNYTRPKACEPENCSASFHCKGSCRLNMKPSKDNPKCILIRRLHDYFEDNGYYFC